MERPARFDRVHVLVRALIVLLLCMLAGRFPWIAFLYLLIPVAAALAVASRGPDLYLSEVAPKATTILRWLGGVAAYVAFLSDRFPTRAEPVVGVEVAAGGRPTLQSALARILWSLPEALALVLLGILEWFVWIVALAFVLATKTYPERLWNFQRGFVRWQLRLLAYHASLVEPMPPFAFETGPEPPARSV